MKIGIAGFGFVGQAVYGSIKQEYDKSVVIYDKFKDTPGKWDELIECDVIFACLPTLSTKNGQDAKPYEEFFKDLIKAEYKGVVVIKSTLLHSKATLFTNSLNIVHNPEFLNQNTSIADFAEQDVIILGGRIDHTKVVKECYYKYFNFDYPEEIEYELCTLEEAMNFKYVHNVYHAYKVLFWNMVQDELGNSRKYSDLYHKVVERNELSKVCADGKKGYGGCCFPKDVMAFEKDTPNPLTKFMIKYNKKLRKEDLY